MVFKIPDLISEISSCMTLEEDDLILTGTPAGVGPVQDGDVITAGMGTSDNPDLCTITFHVKNR